MIIYYKTFLKFVLKKMRSTFLISVFTITLVNFSCSAAKPEQRTTDTIHSLKFLNEYDVPYNFNFQNTTVGGLSGIDYDPQKNIYYLISDDRSAKNPARFYTAKINIDSNKIDSVNFLQTTFLKNNTNNFYPNSQQDPYHTPDPEAMRYDAANNTLIWSSEGERIVTQTKTVLEDPSVTEINMDGSYMDTFMLPQQLHMQAIESGPRQNSVFEGLTFTNDYKNLLVSVEEPLYDDGSRAGTNDSTGVIRIIKFDMASKKTVAQYAYIIDPVAHPAIPSDAFKINGVSDILSLDENKLLVVERSFSTGRLACTIKIFLADLSGADNISDVASLKNNPQIKTASKKLLLNMESLGMYIDNIEGVSLGPVLPDGKQSLLFIADNNFSLFEKTQILLFEID